MKKNKKNRIIFGLWKASSGCSKCGSKDVYYSLQKKIIFYVTQYGSPIVNETEHRYHFIKTQKEMSLFYLNALQFDEYTPKLKHCTYGSEEYKSFLAGLKPALDIHYKNNRHHPEHFANGIKDMTLLDLLEMLCDWKASSERHADGNIYRSIEINQSRFGYSDEVKAILKNTVDFLSALPTED